MLTATPNHVLAAAALTRGLITPEECCGYLKTTPSPFLPPPKPLLQHSLRIQGTSHVAVTGAATEQVMAQAPVSRLGKRDCWRPETDLLDTQLGVQSHSQPLPLTGEHKVPGALV